MATTVTPLPALDRTAPDFRQQTNLFFGSQLPTFTVQINQVSFELMTARDQTVAARDEAVPLANQVITLAPQAIAASNNVSALAPQVAQNAQIAETARANAVAAAAQATAINMGGSTGWPAFPPSMLNDWANSRFLVPAFTRTRAGSATYIDRMGRLRTAASGEPVFEWDATGRCRGLRVEPAATNLLTNSELFTAVAWGKAGATVTPNAAIGDDRTMSASKLVEDNTNTSHLLVQSRNAISQRIEFQISLQAAGRGFACVEMSNNLDSLLRAFVNLSTGEVSAIAVTGTDFTAGTIRTEPRGAGRWRAFLSATKGAVNNVVGAYVYAATSMSVSSYLGDGVSGIFVDRAQLSAPGASYIPTAASAVTRPADVITLPAVSAVDVLNPGQGAFVVEFTLNAPSAAAVVPFAYKNAAGNEMLYADASTSGISVRMTVAGTGAGSANLLPSGAVAGMRYRLAIAYSSAGIRASLNGAPVVAVSPSVTLPLTWDRLDVGLLGSSSQLNGHIANLDPYSRIPSDSSLIAMSTL